MRVALQWILSQAWASTAEALEAIIKIADREDELIIAGAKLPADLAAVFHKSAAVVRLPGRGEDNGNRLEMIDGVAVLSVFGPIFPRANLMTELSGATSAEMVGNNFKAALADPNVRGILLKIDSPGGAVTGVSELADLITSARGTKPVRAFVQGIGASAAYWIASAADQIIAGDTAELGSIGVVAAFKDTREKDAKDGIKTVEVVSSVSPLKRVGVETPEGRMKIQRLVDSIAAVFVEHVARNRGVSVETVLQNFGKGDLFVGARAVEQGLADAVGTFDGVVADMTGIKTKPKGKGSRMAEQNDKPLNAAEVEALHPSAVAEIKTKAAEAERARVQAIEAVKAPGYAEIIAENKWKPEMTSDKIAALVLAAQNEKATAEAAKVKADAEKLAGQAAGIAGDAGAGEAAQRAEEIKAAASKIAAGMNEKR